MGGNINENLLIIQVISSNYLASLWFSCRKSDAQGFSSSYNLLSIEGKVKWSPSMKEIIKIRAFLLPACFMLGRCSGRGTNKHRSPDCNEGLPGSSLSVGVLFSLLWGCLKWQNRARSWRNWETSLFLSSLLGLCGTPRGKSFNLSVPAN